WGDRYDPEFTWIYRLFAWERGLVLPAIRLHFNPVPVSIPIERWIRTTIRVQHLGASSEQLIAERLAKYAHADPEAAHGGARHGRLDAPPRGELHQWLPRPPGLSALAPFHDEQRAQPDVPQTLPQAAPPTPGTELAVLVPVG